MLVRKRVEYKILSSPDIPLEIAFVELFLIEAISGYNIDIDSDAINKRLKSALNM